MGAVAEGTVCVEREDAGAVVQIELVILGDVAHEHILITVAIDVCKRHGPSVMGAVAEGTVCFEREVSGAIVQIELVALAKVAHEHILIAVTIDVCKRHDVSDIGADAEGTA